MEFNATLLFGNGTNTSSDNMIHEPAANTKDPRPGFTPQEREAVIRHYFAVNGICFTVICSIGIICNIINIITLSLAVKRRNFVTHKLFLCMACADLWTMMIVLSYSGCFILQGVVFSLGQPPNLTVPYARYFWLHNWFHFANISIMISNWTAVLMGLFRLIAVSCPLKAQVLSSNVRVHVSIAVVIIGTFLLNIPYWLVTRIDERGAFHEVYELLPNSLITVAFVTPIPIFLCLVVTVALIGKLVQRRRSMEHTLQKHQAEARQKEQHQITITLIVIAIFYVITGIPNTIYWIIEQKLWWDELGVSRWNQNKFYLSAQTVNFIGYAGNFFIYIVGNASFRADLAQLLRFDKIQTFTTKSARTSSSSLPKSRPTTSV